jgi:galactokinase
VCDALKRDDYEEVGRQMYQTHGGLSREYEVSCVELDFLVQEAWLCGVTGARLMGGGFGGCTINLVREELYEKFVAAVQQRYRDQFGRECKIIPVVIGDGARRIGLE